MIAEKDHAASSQPAGSDCQIIENHVFILFVQKHVLERTIIDYFLIG